MSRAEEMNCLTEKKSSSTTKIMNPDESSKRNKLLDREKVIEFDKIMDFDEKP